jgi:hypothetical protein
VGGDGVLGENQLRSDLAVGEVLGDQECYLPLAAGAFFIIVGDVGATPGS